MRWQRELRAATTRPQRVPALFMVGSALFAIGALPIYAQVVDPRVVGLTFFIGSLFFTSAAVGQLQQARQEPDERRLLRAAQVQLVGTFLFNLSTGAALIRTLDVAQENRLVWAPDVFGSIAFLIASHLAWLAVCRRLWCVRRDDSDWWVAALNYVGSIFFMASAIASLTLPTTDELVNTTIVNLGTSLGGVCFLAGAYLLLPAGREVDHP